MKPTLFALGLVASIFAGSGPLPAADFNARAKAMKIELADKVLPYWFDTAQDPKNGGYLLADDAKGRGQARDKQLVSPRRAWSGALHTRTARASAPDGATT